MQFNNNYTTAPTLPNPYVTRKLNNMDKAKIMKEERNNWMRIYYKMLKELEAMIDVQKQVKDMVKIAGEINITVIKIERIILEASINNQTINATNIVVISEDL